MSEYEFSQSQSLSQVVDQQASTDEFGGGRVDLDEVILKRLVAFEGNLEAELERIAAEDPQGYRLIINMLTSKVGAGAVRALETRRLEGEATTSAPSHGREALSGRPLADALLGPVESSLGFVDEAMAQGTKEPAAGGDASTEVVYQCVDVEITRQFQTCTGIDVSDVCIGENPELALQGKRGVAIEGRCIEVAPGLLDDRQLCLHELTHIGQQRGGSPGCDVVMTTVEEAEVQANRVPKAVDAGEQMLVSMVKSFDRLYEEQSNGSRDHSATKNSEQENTGTLSHIGEKASNLRREVLEDDVKELEGTYDDVPKISVLIENQSEVDGLYAFHKDHPRDDLRVVKRYLDLLAPHLTHHDEIMHPAGTIGKNAEGGRLLYIGGCADMSRLIARDLDQLFGIVCEIKSENVSYQLVLEKYRSRGIGGHDYFVFRNREDGKSYGVTHGDDIYNTHFKVNHRAGLNVVLEASQIQRYWASYVNEFNKARIDQIDLMLSHQSARSATEQGQSLKAIDEWASAHEPVRFPFMDGNSRVFIIDDVGVRSVVDKMPEAALLSVFEERGLPGFAYFFNTKNINKYFFTQGARVPYKVLGNVLEKSDDFYHWKVSPDQVNRQSDSEPHPFGEQYLETLAKRYPQVGDQEAAVELLAHLFVLEMSGLRIDGDALQEKARGIAARHENHE